MAQSRQALGDEYFQRQFELHYDRVCAFFSKRGFSPDECEDLTQETFLGVYRGIGRFRGDAKFETWLFQVATNTFRSRLRRQVAGKRSAPTLSWEELQGHEPSIPDCALHEVLVGEQIHALRQAIRSLPPQMQRCVRLRVEQERSHGQIASVMGLSVQTVRAHLFQAKQKLAAKLVEDFDDVDF